MSTKVLLATNNAKKGIELERILESEGLDIEIVTLSQIDAYPEPAETEWTFEGNALIKARAGMEHSGLPTLADDSGFCVDALGGMPGVRSARWAGPQHDDEENLQLVLRQIDDVEEGRRGGQFVSVMALVLPSGEEFFVRGEMYGQVAFEKAGENGFGYDPIFIADDAAGLTTAQLAPEAKDAISHRGKSMRAIVPLLKEHVLAAQN